MDRIDRPRQLPIHQSFLQPLLILGAERELVILSGVLAAMLILSLANFMCALLGGTFWVVSLAVLQRLAKTDPQMSKVYARHVRYRSHYAACAHLGASYPEIKEQV